MDSGACFIGYLPNPSKMLCVRINEIQKVIKDNFNENFIINKNICATFIKTENVQDLYSFRKFIGEQCVVIGLVINDKELFVECSSKIVQHNIDISVGKFTNDDSIITFNNKWLQLFNKQLIDFHFTITNIQFINSKTYDVVDSIVTVESILNNIKNKQMLCVE